MAQVITLSGIEKHKPAVVPSKYRRCTPVTVDSEVLGRAVTVCQEDLSKIEAAPTGRRIKRMKRRYTKRSLPQGVCKRHAIITTTKGQRCKCVEGGHAFAKMDKCKA
jgi:hypothetical protein